MPTSSPSYSILEYLCPLPSRCGSPLWMVHNLAFLPVCFSNASNLLVARQQRMALSPTHPWVNAFVCIGNGKATFATEYGDDERGNVICLCLYWHDTYIYLSCSDTSCSFTNSHVFVEDTSKRVSTFSERSKQSSLPLLVLINHREMIFSIAMMNLYKCINSSIHPQFDLLHKLALSWNCK